MLIFGMKWKELISLLAILGGFFIILFFFMSKWNDLTYLKCISSNPEMIVCQTGPLKPLGVVLSWLVYLIMALFFIPSVVSDIKNWKNERQSQNKPNIKYLIGRFLFLFLLVVLITVTISYVSTNSFSSKIVISNYERVIDIEKHYLLGNEEHIRISFDEIDHILYGHFNGIGGSAEDRAPYSEVEITRLDGMKIEIYKSDWEESEQHYLARVIAEATGKRLIEEEYR